MTGSTRDPMPSTHFDKLNLSGSTIAYRSITHNPQAEQNTLPLILIHGWGGSSRNWQSTLEDLADLRRIYALDLPGYGESPPLIEAPNWERMANMVIEFANLLNLEQFDLNGHSFGAGVATYIAARWPTRVRRLTLTCFSTYRNELERRVVDQFLRQMGLSVALWQPWMALWEPWMALWQPWMVWMGGMTSIYQTLAWRFFYRVPANEHLLREGLEDFLRMHGPTAVENAISASDPMLNTTLAEIKTPTLLIGTRQDMIMPPPGVEVVAQLIPGCELIWIDQCGHIPMIEQRAEYHRLLRAFLLRNP